MPRTPTHPVRIIKLCLAEKNDMNARTGAALHIAQALNKPSHPKITYQLNLRSFE
jgi:hypothetical protein